MDPMGIYNPDTPESHGGVWPPENDDSNKMKTQIYGFQKSGEI